MSTSTLKNPSGVSILGTLPSDIIVEIFSSLNSYESLLAVIATSFIYYELFTVFQEKILARIAQNILGPSWKDATTLLYYQRRTSSLVLPIPLELQPNFVFLRSDIPQLKINQMIFKSIASEFSQFLLNTQLLLGNGTGPRHQPCAPTWYVPVVAPTTIMGTSFVTNSKLPIELFYKLWIHTIYFQNDTLMTFSQRISLTNKEIKNLRFISSFIINNKYYNDFKDSTYKPVKKGRIIIPDLFWSWVKFLPWLNSQEYYTISSPILRLKMIHHLHIVALANYPHCTWAAVQVSGKIYTTLYKFLDDYEGMHVECLIEKYRLNLPRWN